MRFHNFVVGQPSKTVPKIFPEIGRLFSNWQSPAGMLIAHHHCPINPLHECVKPAAAGGRGWCRCRGPETSSTLNHSTNPANGVTSKHESGWEILCRLKHGDENVSCVREYLFASRSSEGFSAAAPLSAAAGCPQESRPCSLLSCLSNTPPEQQ